LAVRINEGEGKMLLNLAQVGVRIPLPAPDFLISICYCARRATGFGGCGGQHLVNTVVLRVDRQGGKAATLFDAAERRVRCRHQQQRKLPPAGAPSGASQSFGQVGEQVAGRSLDVHPTITICPGFPVRVIVTRDLVLERYSA
jgi:hypothetical protein